MRVLYVLDEQGGGGSFHSLAEMINQLSLRHGVDPVVLTSGDNEHARAFREQGLEVVSCPYGSFMQSCPASKWKAPLKYSLAFAKYRAGLLRAPRAAEHAIDFSSIDLIHSNINRVDIGSQLARRNGIPHVQHIREFGDLDFGCWSYAREPGQHISEGADKVICISEAVLDYWVKNKGLDPIKAKVVYNGVDQSRFVPKNRRDDDVVRFVMCGNISETKGQMTVARAFAALPEETRCRATLDFYGELNSDAERIRSFASKEGLSSRVFLRGRSNNIPQVLADYDYGIVASRAEGFGRVLVEYMAAGLGVIASDAGANREILTDERGEIARFFPVENVGVLARQMNDAILSCQKESDKQSRALRRASAFTAENNAEKVWNVYQELRESTGVVLRQAHHVRVASCGFDPGPLCDKAVETSGASAFASSAAQGPRGRD